MNDFELILTVKMETRYPVVGSLNSLFPAISNLCGLMVAWCRKTLKFCEKFLRFLGKPTSYGKIFIILFRNFSSRHRSTLLCSDVVKFGRREICEIVSCLLDKKQTKNCPPLKLSLVCGSRPKSARSSPERCTQSATDFIQIDSLSAEPYA